MRTIYGKDGPKRIRVQPFHPDIHKNQPLRWYSTEYLASIWAKRPAKIIALIGFVVVAAILVVVFASGSETNILSLSGGVTSNTNLGSDGKVRLSTVSSGALAQFQTKQSSSSLLTLDAAGSVGALSWEVDHVAQTQSTSTVNYGPLLVGKHHVKLTATTSSGSVSTERDVDVAWIGAPLDMAQHDNTNGFPISGLNLPQWNPLPAIGPWRNKVVLNEASQVPPGDGIPRIASYADGSISLLTKYGDHPGDSGGYRSSMELNNAYDGTLAGYPLGVHNIDAFGMGKGDGHSGSVRFYRIEFMLPSSDPKPLLYQNNFMELHGISNGEAPVRIATNGAGTQLGVGFTSIVNGSFGPNQNFDYNNIQYDHWYNFVLEVRFDLDPTVGYVRVWRDGAIVTNVPTGTDSQGRYFAVTQQTDINGAVVQMAGAIENYRTKTGMPADYPDAVIHYRNIRFGPTLASVMQ